MEQWFNHVNDQIYYYDIKLNLLTYDMYEHEQILATYRYMSSSTRPLVETLLEREKETEKGV